MGATVTTLGAMSPDELADLCRQVEGCRVEMNGTTYAVYPPGENTRPVFFSSIRLRTSAALENKIRDLRRNGIDVREIVNGPKPAPKPSPPKNPAQEAPTVTAARVPDISPTITRKEAADLRDQVRAASDTAVSLLAEADKAIRELRETVADQGATIDEIRAELRHLREGSQPQPQAKAPSVAQQVRDGVLAFFVAHPGMRITPAMVEANIGDQLPSTRQTTAVNMACKELVKAGKLHGGATRDTPAARKGIYWYEPPADAGENGEQQQ